MVTHRRYKVKVASSNPTKGVHTFFFIIYNFRWYLNKYLWEKHQFELTSESSPFIVNSCIIIIPRRLLVTLAILWNLCVHALLLHASDRGRRLGRHGRARRRTGVRRPGTGSQETLLRRREYATPVGGVHVLPRVRLNFETFGGRKGGGRWKGFQVGEGPKGTTAEGQARMEKLGLKVVENVGGQATVGLHMAEAECWCGERTVQIFCGIAHLELKENWKVAYVRARL